MREQEVLDLQGRWDEVGAADDEVEVARDEPELGRGGMGWLLVKLMGAAGAGGQEGPTGD